MNSVKRLPILIAALVSLGLTAPTASLAAATTPKIDEPISKMSAPFSPSPKVDLSDPKVKEAYSHARDYVSSIRVKWEAETESAISVVYSLTKHGKSLEPLIGQIVAWGQIHRMTVLGQ